MSRALRRHHRARVIANRVAEARRVESASWRQPLLWPGAVARRPARPLPGAA